VIPALKGQLASVDLLENREPQAQSARLDLSGKLVASASVVRLEVLEQPVCREFLETQATRDRGGRTDRRELPASLDQQDRKETSDLRVSLASLVILDLLDLLGRWEASAHREKLVSVGRRDLGEIPDHRELPGHRGHRASEDRRATPDQQGRKDRRALVERTVSLDHKGHSASQELLDQQAAWVRLAARVHLVCRATLALQALKDRMEILVFLVGQDPSDLADLQDPLATQVRFDAYV